MPTKTKPAREANPAAAKTKPTHEARPAAKAKPAPTRMSLADTMTALEQAGSAQTRKTYSRHGATEPMFGVSFATLKSLVKRIKVDHELALALWDTDNFDARNLALKVADPAQMTATVLDRWANTNIARMCHSYVAYLAAEGPHARSRAETWLAAPQEAMRCTGWMLVGAIAMLDETMPDAWFADRLSAIERTIHSAPNEERDAMNRAVISIGCHSAALRKSATDAAKRIGNVEIDYGDTSCKTPYAADYIEKAWTHSLSKNFANPAAHERSRESMRTRC
jgi:3-methyladenine DNA glycosylase AlkD